MDIGGGPPGVVEVTALSGQVAIVTGASKGFGREIALGLAREGVLVVVAARSEEALRAVAGQIGSNGGRALWKNVEVRDPAQCAELVDWTVEQAGGLDILVNNAGLGYWDPVERMPVERWQETFDVNVNGVFYLSRAAVPALRRSPNGHIVNISSVAARRGAPGFSAYAASKAAVITFSESLSRELRDHGIRVSVVAPGTANTTFRSSHVGRPLNPSLTDPDLQLRAEDVADAVLWVLKTDPHVASATVYLDPRG